MSRSAKRIKLEPGTRSNGNRKEIKHPLYSGQFMTSSIDNDAEVNSFRSSRLIFRMIYYSQLMFHVHHLFQMQLHKVYQFLMIHHKVILNDEQKLMVNLLVYILFYVVLTVYIGKNFQVSIFLLSRYMQIKFNITKMEKLSWITY